MLRSSCATAASLLMLLLAAEAGLRVSSAEDGAMPPRPPAPKGDEEAQRKELDRREKMDRLDKMGKKRIEKRAGELDAVEGPLHPPQPFGPAAQGFAAVQALLAQVNVVDRAALGGAWALFQSGKQEEALAAVEKIAQKSPDPEGVGMARLLAGRMQLEKGEAEKANKTLRSVSGRAAILALLSLYGPLARAGDADGLLSATKDLIAVQRSGLEQCRVVKAFLDLVSRQGPGQLDPEARARVLTAAAEWIPYETALAAQEVLSKEPSVLGLALAAPPGPLHDEMRGPLDLQGELGQNFRDLRNLPPEQRREGLQEAKARVGERIEQLRGEGKAAEAERLKEILERMDERGKGGPGPFGKGMKKGERNDPDQMRAEIKKLEEQGKLDEAGKLKKQLEMIERPAGDALEKF